MATGETSKASLQPLLVMLGTGRKLAEKWLTEMGWPADEDSKPRGPILEPRPPGLGVGAVSRETIGMRSNMHARSKDPIERKLLALKAKERSVEKGDNDDKVDEESEEDESESRTKAFNKKKRPVVPPFLNPNKKHK